MRNGPELWDRLLGVVRPVFGDDAVVAGGALRDWRLDLEPKDIDVFVNIEGRDCLENLVAKLNSLGGFDLHKIELAGRADDATVQSEYEQWSSGELFGVAEGKWLWDDGNGYHEFDINIVARGDLANGPWQLIHRFDMGVVQQFYGGECQIYETPDCGRDIANRTATLMRGDTETLSIKRFDRFNARNPGVLTLVNPFKGTNDDFA